MVEGISIAILLESQYVDCRFCNLSALTDSWHTVYENTAIQTGATRRIWNRLHD